MLTHGYNDPVAPARVVVIGAAGFVGGAITRNMQARGVSVLGLSRKDIDLLAADAAHKLAAQFRPDDAIVTVAAIAPVKNAAMLKDNITLIDNLAAALKLQPVAHVVNIGSDAIYADSAEPLDENSPTAPTSLHGVMHLARELMLSEAAGQAPFASLRSTLIYGADDPHNGYGPNRFRRLAAEGKEIVLFGKGEERRDHVLVDDVAELAALMLMHRSRGVLNAATGTVTSFRQAAELIVSQSPKPVGIVDTPRSGPMPHNGYRAFDPAATQAAFPGFRYTSVAEGFARARAAMTGVS
jgi:UDP-glucose 4-epimerase